MITKKTIWGIGLISMVLISVVMLIVGVKYYLVIVFVAFSIFYIYIKQVELLGENKNLNDKKKKRIVVVWKKS